MPIHDPDLSLDSYDYHLPQDCIAQSPASRRDDSKLLHLSRSADLIEHLHFTDIASLLREGDLLVLNESRVFPARFFGSRPGGGKVEMLLLRAESPPSVCRDKGSQHWYALLRPSARVRAGMVLKFGAQMSAFVEGRDGDGWHLRLEASTDPEVLIESVGEIPLPPYIRRSTGEGRRSEDIERYQTVYARVKGSVAAPTAGLHFTHELLKRLQALGVEIERVTLHVGLGTFNPVRTTDIRQHSMHAERYELSAAVWQAVSNAKKQGRRVVAVGTTSVRVLETVARHNLERTDPGEPASAITGETSLFVYPGFQFRVVDAMVTNFHLPRSSLLLLVGALVGRERLLEAYRVAIENGYRFYSYGDAMFID